MTNGTEIPGENTDNDPHISLQVTENPVHCLVPGDEGYDLHLTTARGALKRVDIVNPHLNITPNTVVTTYDLNDEGVRPRTDVYLRLTFFLNLE